MITRLDTKIDNQTMSAHIGYLINKVYKILPLKETEEDTLQKYLEGLQREMLGCESLIPAFEKNGQYLSVVSIIQYMIDNDCELSVVKSDVFKAIGILRKMQQKFDRG